MQAQVTAIVQRDGDWWIGWIEEIPGANAQERTREELLASLREAANDILALHREAALREAMGAYEEIPLVLRSALSLSAIFAAVAASWHAKDRGTRFGATRARAKSRRYRDTQRSRSRWYGRSAKTWRSTSHDANTQGECGSRGRAESRVAQRIGSAKW